MTNKEVSMKLRNNTCLLAIGLVCVGAGFMAGCSSDEIDVNIDDNKGSKLTTTPGTPITEQQLLGKWDLDGERTNLENGKGGAAAIGSNIFKDMFGSGWKFEPKGVIKFDKTGGYTVGSYAIEGDKVKIRYTGGATDYVYQAHFQEGYLYLKDTQTKTYRVFEKSKFMDF
jgi:hypothetical protein